MSRLIRFAAPVLAALLAAGCDGTKKGEGTPNPELKVPDVPAGGRGSKGELKDVGGKKP